MGAEDFAGKKFVNQIYLLILLVVLALAYISFYTDPSHFAQFIGDLNPLLAISITGLLGLMIHVFCLRSFGFSILKSGRFTKSLRYAWLVILFAIVAILVDWKITLPIDINIPFPDSLLFYPAIAFMVELVFHVIPLAMALMLANRIFKNIDEEKVTFGCILLVAIIEPTFQILMDSYPIGALIVTWLNILLFNLTQLFIYKRYGFIPMYCSRLIYYSIWHIAWGYFRLDILF